MAILTVRAAAANVFSAPVYQAVSAADKFPGVPGSRYVLHYKNGATPQASGATPNKLNDPTTPIPGGSSAVAGFADVATSGATGMGATSEATVYIPNSSRHIDSQGFINLTHAGTVTTVTVDIYGPLQ